jgi:hypothetical protein
MTHPKYMATVWVVMRQQTDCGLIILEGIYSTEAKAGVKADQLMAIIRECGEWKLISPNYWENSSGQIYIEERTLDRYDEERDY